ncbi:pilus assembly protein TadG-related protein [Sneathiella marina]|uniref:Pilus assembly protein TadG-related protein n=1 Tax=Sneathiella marina TaxID=2950108 RepID=A0ABY4W6Z6_9PROT|nr:pilus assembly protein TadG-related protein [Sneathiella marina]USG62938.1 pilus assembly protein TadG-related protein [Sneathiella marina]
MNKRFSFTSFRQSLKEFGSNTNGVSAVIIAFLAIPLFGFVGLSVDLGRAYVLKSKLSTALDAAGLAAGRNIFSPDAEIYADAQKYFDANFPPGYMGTAAITMDSSTISWDTDKENITLSVRADMATTFMNVLKQPELTVGANTEIKRDNRGMELVLVLDNTGSMTSSSGTGTRLSVLKEASTNLIDILYGGNETNDKLWVSIVPYTTTVNIGPQNIGWLKSSYPANLTSNTNSIFTQDSSNTALGRDVTGDSVNDTVYGWEGCIEMRDHLINGTVDMSDDPPNNDFVPYFWDDYHKDLDNVFYDDPDESSEYVDDNVMKNNWKRYRSSRGGDYFSITTSRGPNEDCPPVILPLTAEKTTITDKIDDMVADGATAVNIGLVWGWRALSPRWNGEWYGSSTINLPTNTKVTPQVPYTSLPLNYFETYMDKVVILMTDGINTLGSYDRYHAYARSERFDTTPTHSYYDYRGFLNTSLPSDGDSYPDKIDQKMLATCTAMKSAGIIIYTVEFVSGNLAGCATSTKHAFVATTAADLLDDFNTIGEELSNLRISK